MALFKKSRDGEKGGPWIARYRDSSGIVRERSTKCNDKSDAQSGLTDWHRDTKHSGRSSGNCYFDYAYIVILPEFCNR